MKCQKCGDTLPGPSQRHRANPFCRRCMKAAFEALPTNPADQSKSFMSPRSIKQLEERTAKILLDYAVIQATSDMAQKEEKR